MDPVETELDVVDRLDDIARDLDGLSAALNGAPSIGDAAIVDDLIIFANHHLWNLAGDVRYLSRTIQKHYKSTLEAKTAQQIEPATE